MPRHFRKLAAAPMLGFPDRPRREPEQWRSGDAVPTQKLLDARARCCGNGKREIGRAVVQAQDRPDVEITVDGVHIERGYRDVMRVGEPASFPRSLPRVLAREWRELAVGSGPDLRAGPVEADANGRAGCKRQQRGTQ